MLEAYISATSDVPLGCVAPTTLANALRQLSKHGVSVKHGLWLWYVNKRTGHPETGDKVAHSCEGYESAHRPHTPTFEECIAERPAWG